MIIVRLQFTIFSRNEHVTCNVPKCIDVFSLIFILCLVDCIKWSHHIPKCHAQYLHNYVVCIMIHTPLSIALFVAMRFSGQSRFIALHFKSLVCFLHVGWFVWFVVRHNVWNESFLLLQLMRYIINCLTWILCNVNNGHP